MLRRPMVWAKVHPRTDQCPLPPIICESLSTRKPLPLGRSSGNKPQRMRRNKSFRGDTYGSLALGAFLAEKSLELAQTVKTKTAEHSRKRRTRRRKLSIRGDAYSETAYKEFASTHQPGSLNWLQDRKDHADKAKIKSASSKSMNDVLKITRNNAPSCIQLHSAGSSAFMNNEIARLKFFDGKNTHTTDGKHTRTPKGGLRTVWKKKQHIRAISSDHFRAAVQHIQISGRSGRSISASVPAAGGEFMGRPSSSSIFFNSHLNDAKRRARTSNNQN